MGKVVTSELIGFWHAGELSFGAHVELDAELCDVLDVGIRLTISGIWSSSKSWLIDIGLGGEIGFAARSSRRWA